MLRAHVAEGDRRRWGNGVPMAATWLIALALLPDHPATAGVHAGDSIENVRWLRPLSSSTGRSLS